MMKKHSVFKIIEECLSKGNKSFENPFSAIFKVTFIGHTLIVFNNCQNGFLLDHQ